MKNLTIFAAMTMLVSLAPAANAQETDVFWGNTHLHTNLSVDSYNWGNQTVGPDDAFRFARGGPVVDAASGARVALETPLDFLVVTDHAEYLGVATMLASEDPIIANTPTGIRFRDNLANGQGSQNINEMLATLATNVPIGDLVGERIATSAWQQAYEAAERHNDPGRFTAFIGWEWTSTPSTQNVHRIIFTPQGAEAASQFLPFSTFESDVESDLWAWLEATSQRTGADFVAIAHNGNLSNGLMFPLINRAGMPVDANYANTRMRWEPVIETTQAKGDSETHPVVSPNDQFADFETLEHTFNFSEESALVIDENHYFGDYTRAGLLRGLQFEQSLGVNPYQIGMIGSIDAHSGLSTAEEDNFWGKTSDDSTPATSRTFEMLPGLGGWDMSASGLAAVWATGNTRQAIAEAFQRREVYATTGPRIVVRLFGGWGFDDEDANTNDLASVGYAGGVPMGGELTEAPRRGTPRFLVHAAKDPVGANLDRIQMVKGWVDADGQTHEQVYDIEWSGVGRDTGERGVIGPIRNTVDLETGLYTNSVGSAQLATVWQDPDFDADLRAFYYVRVLEIPTMRHSALDALALEIEISETNRPATIQERAYSSPIWYSPN